MNEEASTLNIHFDGTVTDRNIFLAHIRTAVIEFTGESMKLDTLISEMAKNIFDHARGNGFLVIELRNGSFEFEIKDDGERTHDFENDSTRSTLAGNGTNFGIGLSLIRDLATSLGIDLQVNTSQGFSYSGTYTPGKQVS